MKYLSTGEFASLCRTRKDTLLFYDKEGLLKPRLVSENGYRRYSIGQFYEFDMVAMLKESLRRFPTGTYMVWYPKLHSMQSRELPEKLKRLPGIGEGQLTDDSLAIGPTSRLWLSGWLT